MKAVRCMSSVGCVVDVGVHEEIDGREIKFIASCTMCRPIFELCVNFFLSYSQQHYMLCLPYIIYHGCPQTCSQAHPDLQMMPGNGAN